MWNSEIYNVERIKPDLEIISTRGSYLIDVVLTHPSAPSRNRSKLVPLNAAKISEGIKQRKYGLIADARGSVCDGFAIETFGAWGKEAVEVMKLLESMMLEQRGNIYCSSGLECRGMQSGRREHNECSKIIQA